MQIMLSPNALHLRQVLSEPVRVEAFFDCVGVGEGEGVLRTEGDVEALLH